MQAQPTQPGRLRAFVNGSSRSSSSSSSSSSSCREPDSFASRDLNRLKFYLSLSIYCAAALPARIEMIVGKRQAQYNFVNLQI